MDLVETVLLAVGLSMDAFAVSVCKGLSLYRVDFRDCAVCGLWFGIFQALMPLIGYSLGAGLTGYITIAASWIGFVILVLIGSNMVRESLSKEKEKPNADLRLKTMLTLAVATSIDALAVGVTFALVPVTIAPERSSLLNTITGSFIIGATTFILSCTGVKLGNIFGIKYKSKAELAGGIILICLGLKIIL